MRHHCIIMLAILLFCVYSVSALETALPLSQSEFNILFEKDPSLAARQAVASHSGHLLYNLNYSLFEPYILESLLEIGMDDSFPPNKIADALERGAVLRVSTWKRLTSTQLSYALHDGSRVRDHVPDLTQLGEEALDESIKIDSGLPRETTLMSSPVPGATTTTLDSSVIITGLEKLYLELPGAAINGEGLEGARIGRGESGSELLSIDKARLIEIRLPSARPDMRGPVHPEIGSINVGDVSFRIENITAISLGAKGGLEIGMAGSIKAMRPDPSMAGLGILPASERLKIQNKPKPAAGTIFESAKAEDCFSTIPGMALDGLTKANWSDINQVSASWIACGQVKSLSLPGAQFGLAKNISVNLTNGVLGLDRARDVSVGELSISQLGPGAIQIPGGPVLVLAPMQSAQISVGGIGLNYQAHGRGNYLRLEAPLLGESQTRFITINDASVQSSKEDLQIIVDAGNQTRIRLNDKDGLTCAAMSPFSSAVISPGKIIDSISLATLNSDMKLCFQSYEKQDFGGSCLYPCNVLSIPDMKLTTQGIVDVQRYRTFNGELLPAPGLAEPMRSIFSAYKDHTGRLTFSKDLSSVQALEVEGAFDSYSPNNFLRVIDQQDHRLVSMDPGSKTVSDLEIKSVSSSQFPALSLTDTYAVQKTSGKQSVFILYPGNPQIKQLIEGADKRLNSLVARGSK